MENIKLQREFNEISKKFNNNDFDLGTIADLVDTIRRNITELTEEEIEFLLEIPITLLTQAVTVKDLAKWQKENSKYFSHNMFSEGDEIIDGLKIKFQSENYSLDDIWLIAIYVRDNFTSLMKEQGKIIEYPLRNVAVTFRHHVELINKDDLYASGNMFSRYIDKAISL